MASIAPSDPAPAFRRRLGLSVTVACVVAVSGCGGGGGGGGGGGASPAASPVAVDPGAPVDLNKAAEIYGIASDGVGGDAGGDGGAAGGAGDGSPLRRVRVTLTDAKGHEVAGTTDANGKFLLMYKTAEFVPPLVLRTFDAEGNVLASSTDEVTPSGKAIRASINPLTDKITSDALAGVEGTDRPFDGSKIDLNKLKAAKSDLVNSVKDALAVVGVTDSSRFDPVKSVYNYDGTGVDAVIDSISHSRYPDSGATQLRAKLDLLGADSNGNVAPTFITADRPLKTDSVAVASSQALTFAKINAWINEMNRCLALSSADRAADAECVDADGSRLVSPNYKHNGKDVAESYRRLFSETDRSAVQGSALSNPSILFNAPPEGAQDYESAVVQFTVDQPRSGPLDVFERPKTPTTDGASYPIRYTITTVFRRDDGLTRAKAGNWILHGNQANYDFNVQPSYWRGRQVNPSQQQGRFRSGYSSALEILASPQRFDMTIKRFVSADIRAVRVRGPGLPDAGLVLSTPTGTAMYGRVSQDSGPNSLSPDNRRGEILSGTMSTRNWGRTFFLNSIDLDGGQPGNYDLWGGTGEEVAEPRLTDFAPMQAYSRYSFEVFLNSNTDTSKADEIQFVRIMAPVMPPTFSVALQRNEVSSSAYLTPPEQVPSRLCAASVGWTNNLDATQVDSMFMVGAGTGGQPPGIQVLFRGPAEVAMLDGQRSSGAVVGNCNWQVYMPSLQVENSFRLVAAGATEKRSRIWEATAWTSDPPAPAPSPTP